MTLKTVNVEGCQDIDGRDIEWQATVRLSYLPAKLYGPPEHCYPEESEAEIVALTTRPEKFEERIDEQMIEELAWEKFHTETAAADAADYADYIKHSLGDR